MLIKPGDYYRTKCPPRSYYAVECCTNWGSVITVIATYVREYTLRPAVYEKSKAFWWYQDTLSNLERITEEEMTLAILKAM